jgi:hypothetical protein
MPWFKVFRPDGKAVWLHAEHCLRVRPAGSDQPGARTVIDLSNDVRQAVVETEAEVMRLIEGEK